MDREAASRGATGKDAAGVPRGGTGAEPVKIIFFGNGPLSEAVLGVLEKAVRREETGAEKPKFEIIFHARDKADLARVKELKKAHPEAHGVLASYGVMIREDVLGLFEPEGILNVHPSLLPRYRGASPIESAILAGDTEFGVSVMKLVLGMDAGPIYWQGVVPEVELAKLAERADILAGETDIKTAIYQGLGETGAEWTSENLGRLPEPKPQDETKATFTSKMSKEMGILDPATKTAAEIYRKIIALQGWPKAKYAFFGQNCLVLAAHIAEQGERVVLTIPCADGRLVAVDRVQPEGRRPMDAKSFVNGYGKH